MENFRYFGTKTTQFKHILFHACLTDPGYVRLNFCLGTTDPLPMPRLFWLFRSDSNYIRISHMLGVEGRAEKDFSRSRFFYPGFPNQGYAGSFCDHTNPVYLRPKDEEDTAKVEQACMKFATRFMMGRFNHDIPYFRHVRYSPFVPLETEGLADNGYRVFDRWAKTPMEQILSKRFFPHSVGTPIVMRRGRGHTSYR